MRIVGEAGLATTGAILLALGLGTIALSKLVFVAALSCLLVGFGFYMLHGCIQVQATEIAPTARGAAMALHSFFFFMGQAIGPVLYGFGFVHFGTVLTLSLAGAIMLLVGILASRLVPDRSALA